MIGVILAGGTGSRLDPLTRAVNKHLLPMGCKPMICHAVERLEEVGFDEIVVVTGPEHIGSFQKLLGYHYKGAALFYGVQRQPGGVAQAIGVASAFTKDSVAVLLGDNIYWGVRPLLTTVEAFKADHASGARVLLSRRVSYDPLLHESGVALMRDGGEIAAVYEKPEEPPSDLVVTGFYCFDHTIWKKLKHLHASPRGEFEVTDLLNEYAAEHSLRYDVLRHWHQWTDAGSSIEAYHGACALVRTNYSQEMEATR